MPKAPVQRLILALKPRAECVEALRRYVAFFEMSQTGFLERKIKHYERLLLERLTPAQTKQYYAGTLTLAGMSEAERAAFLAPTEAYLKAKAASRAALPPRENTEVEALVS